MGVPSRRSRHRKKDLLYSMETGGGTLVSDNYLTAYTHLFGCLHSVAHCRYYDNYYDSDHTCYGHYIWLRIFCWFSASTWCPRSSYRILENYFYCTVIMLMVTCGFLSCSLPQCGSFVDFLPHYRPNNSINYHTCYGYRWLRVFFGCCFYLNLDQCPRYRYRILVVVEVTWSVVC